MKSLKFLGITGALLTASCQQMQQMTLVGRETVRVPNGQEQQVLLFSNGNEMGLAEYVHVQTFKNKAEARKDAKENPIGKKQFIRGWEHDNHPLEYIGGSYGGIIVTEQKTR